MIYYEFKKLFGSWGSKIAILILAAVVILNCWTATNARGTSWINEKGDEETGHAAVEKLRTARKEWAGPLTTEHLTAALRENQRINATPEAQSNSDDLNDIAYGWKQGISDIREVINGFLSEGFQEYSYYRADSVREADLPGLYENRVQLLKNWLYEEGTSADNLYSQQEKEWLIRQYEDLEAPMYYTWFEGWAQLCENSTLVTMMCAMILGYLVAGIFANEFKWRADSIYFSTMLGRTVNTKEKILAGFLLVTAVYWVCMAVYSMYTLIYLGFDGWSCPIQLNRWKCPYNLIFLEMYLLTILGGYLGNLFSAFLVMWVSAKTKSAVVAVTLPFLLIFLPTFLQNYEGSFIGDVLGLLPDRLLQVNYAINYFDVYSLGTLVVGAIPLLFILYPVITACFIPAMYRAFGRKEVI